MLFHIIQKLQPYWFISQKEAYVSTQGKWHVWVQATFLSNALLCFCGPRKDRHKRGEKQKVTQRRFWSAAQKKPRKKKNRVWIYTLNWLVGEKCWEVLFVLLNCVDFCGCKQWRRSYMKEIVSVFLFTQMSCVLGIIFIVV